jgi:hypothetical protein
MRKLFLALLIIGAVVGAIALMNRRRSTDEIDEWAALSEDAAERVQEAAEGAIEAAEDAAS